MKKKGGSEWRGWSRGLRWTLGVMTLWVGLRGDASGCRWSCRWRYGWELDESQLLHRLRIWRETRRDV